MSATSSTIQVLDTPSDSELDALLGEDEIAFVKNLTGPTWITIKGVDRSRRRAIVTLLHANEPSGLKAIYQLLKEHTEPATDIGLLIVSVEAAKYPPMFSHRYLPTEMDMNRCFGQQGDTAQKTLANNIVELLLNFGPEAVIDTHNTSAHSEPFAVATGSSTPIKQVVQLFTRKLVSLDQKLGTLIEQDLHCPVVTIEFGGFLDPNSDELALSSLERFFTQRNLFELEPEPIQVLESPMRLEVLKETHLHYSTTVESTGDVTIFNTIDQLNFRRLKARTTLGWIDETALGQLIVRDKDQKNIAADLFMHEDGFLKNKLPLTLFMATTDDHIARNDCLMYLCPEEL